jgi:hypothetical protein
LKKEAEKDEESQKSQHSGSQNIDS